MNSSSRVKSSFLFLLLAAGLCGADCPPPDGSTNGNSNGNTSGPNLTVILDGEHDTEFFMGAVIVVGDRVVTRAEAAAGLSTEFSVADILTIDPGDLTRTTPVEAGKIVTIIAVENEGNPDNITQFSEEPEPYDGHVEFVSFSGDADAIPQNGVATWTAGDADAEIVVHFRRMPQITLFTWGATQVYFEFSPPDVLGLPLQENEHNKEFVGATIIAAPNTSVYRTMQLKSGTEATFTAIPTGEFLRWEGACGGSGLECTLTFGGDTGSEDQTTMLVTGYLECNQGGSISYSGYGNPNNPPMGCTIVRP